VVRHGRDRPALHGVVPLPVQSATQSAPVWARSETAGSFEDDDEEPPPLPRAAVEPKRRFGGLTLLRYWLIALVGAIILSLGFPQVFGLRLVTFAFWGPILVFFISAQWLLGAGLNRLIAKAIPDAADKRATDITAARPFEHAAAAPVAAHTTPITASGGFFARFSGRGVQKDGPIRSTRRARSRDLFERIADERRRMGGAS